MSRYIFIYFFVAIVLYSNLHEANGARILGIFPIPAPSHYILGNKLMKELALRGHEVTMINAYGLKTPMKNYKDVVLEELKEDMKKHTGNALIEANSKSILEAISHFFGMTFMLTEKTLEHPKTKKLLNSGENFDLIIIDAFLNEAHVIFAHHFKAPLILLSTVGSNFFVDRIVENPAPLSYCSFLMLGKSGKMGFTDRLLNTVVSTSINLFLDVFHYPKQNALMHKHFPGAPDITDIMNERLSLILLNSHPSISPALPSVPNMIEIGGYHVEEPKELPKDLKKYCDDAKDGFILFSMGSNLKSTMLSEDKRNILLSVFKKLPYKVLWKFEDDNLPGKPDNVKIEKWLPQNDILAHPYLKLFITHGGLLSTTEAVYNAVPLVGIPVYGDQKMNMATAKSLGFAEIVDFVNLNHDDLLDAIQKVLNNKSYLENVRNRSILLHDQPLKPIDTAMFWIEHAIRHKSNNHLKTNAIYLKWWELWNLDVIAFLGTFVLVIISTFYWILKKMCQLCFKNKSNKKEMQAKKKRN